MISIDELYSSYGVDLCLIHRFYHYLCTELIEETGRPPGLIFGMWGYFWPGSDKFESWKKFTHLTEL